MLSRRNTPHFLKIGRRRCVRALESLLEFAQAARGGEIMVHKRGMHAARRGPITPRCLQAKHLKCSDDNCACICHRDPVLVSALREQYLKISARGKKAA